jgi:hypothetical protein
MDDKEQQDEKRPVIIYLYSNCVPIFDTLLDFLEQYQETNPSMGHYWFFLGEENWDNFVLFIKEKMDIASHLIVFYFGKEMSELTDMMGPPSLVSYSRIKNHIIHSFPGYTRHLYFIENLQHNWSTIHEMLTKE